MVNCKALKLARVAAGFSQRSLAEELGMKQSNYHLKEKGIVGFTDKDKLAIAKLLNLDLDVFYYIFFNNEFQLANMDCFERYITKE